MDCIRIFKPRPKQYHNTKIIIIITFNMAKTLKAIIYFDLYCVLKSVKYKRKTLLIIISFKKYSRFSNQVNYIKNEHEHKPKRKRF